MKINIITALIVLASTHCYAITSKKTDIVNPYLSAVAFNIYTPAKRDVAVVGSHMLCVRNESYHKQSYTYRFKLSVLKKTDEQQKTIVVEPDRSKCVMFRTCVMIHPNGSNLYGYDVYTMLKYGNGWLTSSDKGYVHVE